MVAEQKNENEAMNISIFVFVLKLKQTNKHFLTLF